ncbi:MAG: hypothetical protein Q8936_22240 [Bacillota bacterium]|nr:hypothetical protein [Bacillota bacterium]
MFKPLTDYDFRIYSDDKTSHITFTLEEYVHYRLPCLSCTIEILDNKYKGWNTSVWFTLEDLLSFIIGLEDLERTRQGKLSLNAMSPEDFNITFENYNKKGNIVAYYSISNIKYNAEINLRNILTGGFQVDSEFFSKVLSDFKQFTSVTELEEDITFK